MEERLPNIKTAKVIKFSTTFKPVLRCSTTLKKSLFRHIFGHFKVRNVCTYYDGSVWRQRIIRESLLGKIIGFIKGEKDE